jgi:hypothetical protein
MTGTTDGSLPGNESCSKRPRGVFGTIALALWGLALTCSAVDALLAFDRIRVLVFTGGLVMMDLAAAVFFSLCWFQVRTPPGPVLNASDLGVFAEHIWLAAYSKCQDDNRAAEPRLIPTQDTGPIRGYYAAPDTDRTNDHVS